MLIIARSIYDIAHNQIMCSLFGYNRGKIGKQMFVS
jgi:hypothetical protein